MKIKSLYNCSIWMHSGTKSGIALNRINSNQLICTQSYLYENVHGHAQLHLWICICHWLGKCSKRNFHLLISKIGVDSEKGRQNHLAYIWWFNKSFWADITTLSFGFGKIIGKNIMGTSLAARAIIAAAAKNGKIFLGILFEILSEHPSIIACKGYSSQSDMTQFLGVSTSYYLLNVQGSLNTTADDLHEYDTIHIWLMNSPSLLIDGFHLHTPSLTNHLRNSYSAIIFIIMFNEMVANTGNMTSMKW